MPSPLYLDLVDEGPMGRLYAFRHPDEDDELTQFLTREDGTTCTTDQRRACHENLDHQTCRHRCGRYEFGVRMQEMLVSGTEATGFLEHYFARLDRYPFPVGALKAGRYRLYGVFYGPDLFVVGDGGLKLVPTIQGDADLSVRYQRVCQAAQRLDDAIKGHCGSHVSLPRDAHGVRYLPSSLLSL